MALALPAAVQAQVTISGPNEAAFGPAFSLKESIVAHCAGKAADCRTISAPGVRPP